MEASSQALKYHRTLGTRFAAAAFLNIGRDHISPIEHPDFEDYFQSKLKIFDQCKVACVNLDSDRKEDILCVRGNCEAEVDQMVLDFPVLAEYAILTEGTRMIFATHGHVFNESHLPPLHKGDILLHGHTHVPKCTEHETYVYLNPGSVSIPKEGSHHGYMTLENGVFLWKDLEGNEKHRYAMHA